MPAARHSRVDAAAVRFELLEARQLFSGIPAALAHRELPAAAHAVHAAATAGGTGISAEYFADPGLTSPQMVRTDASISFKGSAGPSASLKAAGGAEWTGSIATTATSTYTFSVQGTGGVKLWVNGVQLISTAAIPGGAVRATAPIALTAGVKYAFRMDYSKAAGAAPNVKLLWAANKAKQVVVPQTSLFPSATPPALAATSAGLIGQYYLGGDFKTLAFTRVDPAINFNFGSKSPDPSIPNHTPFSIVWNGQVHPAQSGNYTFTTHSDDGVRVYVGTQLVIDNFVQQSTHAATGQIALTAGQAYDLKVEYFQNGVGVGDIKLQYNLPGAAPAVLTGSLISSTPPATAGVLTAIAAAADEVDLAWTGSPAATGYTVSRSADDGFTWAADGTTPAGTTTFADTGLTANTAYEYKVTPFGSAATSTPSNVVAVTTLLQGPAVVSVTVDSPTAVDLTWSDVPGETGFDVLESVGSSPFALVDATPAGVTTDHLSGLLPGTSYTFEVESLNGAAAPSAPTVAGSPSATPTAAPAALVSTGATSTTVSLAWADTLGEGGFLVERSTDGTTWAPAAVLPAGTLTYTDGGLTPGTTYSYRVRGLSAADPSVASAPSPVTTGPTATAAPGNVSATDFSATRIDLAWADVTGGAGFTVLASADGGATFLPVGATAAHVTHFSATPLVPGVAYQFEVEAVNAAGKFSDASAPVAATTAPLAPAIATALGTSPTTATVTWSPVVAATGYVVQRSTDGTTWTAVATPAAAAVTYADTGLSAGVTYTYRVLATDAGGASTPSPVATAVTIPAIPVAALAGLNVATSSVSFPAVVGATSYAVQRSTDGATGWTTVATVPAGGAAPAAQVAGPADAPVTTLSATVANIAPSTVYYYRVISSNATGSSAPSAVVGQMSAPLAQYASDSQLFGLATGATGPGSIYSIDMTAGSDTLIGQLVPGAYVLNRNPLNGLIDYAVGSTSNTPTTYSWDPSTGNNTNLGTRTLAAPVSRAAFDSAGTTWITDTAGDLYKLAAPAYVPVKVATLSLAGVTPTTMPGNMVFSPAGALYLANGGTIYTVNLTTAVLTPTIQLGTNNVNIVFGSNGLLYATDSQGHEYSVNPTTLVSTLLGNPAVPAFNSLTATPEFVDLGVAATANPTILQPGHTAAYAVNVTNAGPTTADTGSINVTVTLGSGLTFASVAGTGWTAVAATGATGVTVVMTYAGSLIASGNAPTATLTVNVASSAAVPAVTTFSVAGDQFDTGATNNTAVVTSTVA